MGTYAEILDVSKNLIVEGKVIARNDIDTSLLLDIPVLKTESLGLSKKVRLRDLASPVSFRGLLQVTVDSHARETEDRSDIKQILAVARG
jgi:hypothetical protein